MTEAAKIKNRVRRLEEVPTLPAFFSQIMETIEDERTSASDLAKIIGQDPALTAKIFKLSNSAYYGRFKKVSTIEHAVTTVGFQEIKTISLSIAVFGSFSHINNLNDFWVHAMTSAQAIRQIGDRNQESSIDKVYFGGLLHDVGKLVLTLLLGDEYLELTMQAEDAPSLLSIEKENFGATHSDVGRWLGEKWHFPGELVEMIAHHHNPSKRTLLRPRSVATVYVGDFIAHNTNLTEPDQLVVEDHLQSAMKLLNISAQELVDVAISVNEEQEKIRETLALIA